MRTLFTLLLAAASLPAAVKLPALISDHMVLQQGKPARIWGTADPAESVQVALQGQTIAVKADEKGKWTAWLRPLIAGGPLDLTVNNLTVHDVLVGEVWLGSGQSNMEFRLQTAVNHDEEIAHANYPLIRLFQVKHAIAEQPMDDVVGTWQLCSPAAVKSFSAVEYFFGRHLQQDLHVPMGLIESDWGGTPAQSWISRPALETDASMKYVTDDWDQTLARYPAAKQRFDQQMEQWNTLSAQAKSDSKPAPPRPNPPAGPGHQNTPASLYNGMIAPLTPYAIRGFIWYQGESNANELHAYRYRHLFANMIEDWRSQWGEGEIPFLYVQLANFQTNGWWPLLRESQTDTLRLRNTGMALAIDIGESKDIHPKNKQDVGLRLALAARAIAYHEPVEYSGPMFETAAPEGNAMRAYFTHADGMRATGADALKGFEVAGADGKFVAADAKVEGNTVLVSSAQIEAPVAVRYAWADDPVCNLVNLAGLPAIPFRSGERINAK
ncbi:MAG TPA: sialate O-acetylesterase [Bryobacteraceae bacterium]|jgi:sialate O-acetylesterase|nr:sialate O-acetylesterase [Bryobacteraceae bacterium]